MRRRYALLDVFTETPLTGNPLAVVLDGDGLDDERMQAVAREFNLSETVFVQAPQNTLHTARVSIFTPARKLPFAGHPTVGAAVLLALQGAAENRVRETVIILEEDIGPVRCGALARDSGAAGRAIFDLPQPAHGVAGDLDIDGLATALGLMPAELGFENHEPSIVSAGLAFAFVPVRDLETVGRAKPNKAIWHEAFSGNAAAAFVYCRETAQTDHHFHARVFAPTLGIDEDPATGSAVAALSAVVARFDAPPAGTHRYTIEQGFEMGRPSLIELEIDMEGGRIESARIGGNAVVIAEGFLSL